MSWGHVAGPKVLKQYKAIRQWHRRCRGRGTVMTNMLKSWDSDHSVLKQWERDVPDMG